MKLKAITIFSLVASFYAFNINAVIFCTETVGTTGAVVVVAVVAVVVVLTTVVVVVVGVVVARLRISNGLVLKNSN